MTDVSDVPVGGDVIDGSVVPSPGAAVVLAPPRGIDLPELDEWRKLQAYAATIANSGLVGRHLRGNTDACMVVILKGRELRLPPMEAVNSVFVIEGTPTLRASTMSALILRDGHEIWPDDNCDDRRAVMYARRRRPDGTYGDLVTVTYTIEEARTANLLGKDNWKRHPGDMLVARCTSRAGRRMFSDVLMGCVYVPEELGAVEVDGRVEVPAPRRAAAIGTGYEQPPAAPAAPAAAADAAPAPATPAEEPAEPEPTPPREDLEAEFRDIAAALGKSPAQLAIRWIKAHKKNIEDATDDEMFAFVKSYREVAAEARASAAAKAEQEPAEPAPPADPPGAPAVAEPAPHPYRYNEAGDNDACEEPGCGLAVDAGPHVPPAEPGEPGEPGEQQPLA